MYLRTRVEDNRGSAALLRVAFLTALCGARQNFTPIDEIINTQLVKQLVSLAKKKKLNNTTGEKQKRNSISLDNMVKMFTYERLVQAYQFVRKKWEELDQELVHTKVGILEAKDIMDKLAYYNDVSRFLHSSIINSKKENGQSYIYDPAKSLIEACLALGIEKYPLESKLAYENVVQNKEAFERGLAMVKSALVALNKQNRTRLKYLQCDWNSVVADPNEILGVTEKLEADKCSKVIKAIEDLNLASLESGRELTHKQKEILYDPVVNGGMLHKGYDWFESGDSLEEDDEDKKAIPPYFATYGRYGSIKENIERAVHQYKLSKRSRLD